MSEWQPARYVNAHKDGTVKTGEFIRVRETPFAIEAEWRMVGCDATRFFLIHDDDVVRLGKIPPCGACEHEILTD